jgi:hypothetical protein
LDDSMRAAEFFLAAHDNVARHCRAIHAAIGV